MKRLLACAATALVLMGCSTKTRIIDTENDDRNVQTAALDYRDYTQVTQNAVDSMLANITLQRECALGSPACVVAIGSIINDTTQSLDVTQLSRQMRVSLLDSGRFMTTLSVGVNQEDALISDSVNEQIRASEEFNAETVTPLGSAIAPDYALSGKISERIVRLDNNKKQIEYAFSWGLTDMATRLQVWESESIIVKETNANYVNW